MPKLPQELGGGPITPISQGVRWVTLAYDMPPKPLARLVVQAQNAEAAGQLRGIVDAGIRSLKAKENLPAGPVPEIENAIAALTPEVAGDQLRLTIDAPKATELIRLFISSKSQPATKPSSAVTPGDGAASKSK